MDILTNRITISSIQTSSIPILLLGNYLRKFRVNTNSSRINKHFSIESLTVLVRDIVVIVIMVLVLVISVENKIPILENAHHVIHIMVPAPHVLPPFHKLQSNLNDLKRIQIKMQMIIIIINIYPLCVLNNNNHL